MEDVTKGSKWDKISDSIGPQAIDEQKTIIISQPTGSHPSLSNTEPLTDEYLNSILPTTGYKIIPVPKKYERMITTQRVSAEQVEDPHLQRIPKEFQSLYTDFRPDDELDPQEKSERFVMKLLMQIKDGSVYQRKQAIRLLTTHAPKIGPELVFRKFFALAETPALSELEKHSLVKTLDRLMYRMSDSISEHIPRLLDFIGKMLVDDEPVTRAEGREIISNLAKICGLPEILSICRDKLGSEVDEERNIISTILATTSTAVGIQSILPLLNALVLTRRPNAEFYKDTGLRIIKAIAFQNRNGILPFLGSFVKLLSLAFDDDDRKVKVQAIMCTKAVAEASAPYGGDVFTKLTEKIFIDWNDQHDKYCLAALAALLLTMKQNVAAAYFNRMSRSLPRYFASTEHDVKLNAIVLFENALSKDTVSVETIHEIMEEFLRNYWNLRTPLMKSISQHLINVTSMIAQKASLDAVLDCIFAEFKNSSMEYMVVVCKCLRTLIKACDLAQLDEKLVEIIADNLIFAFINAKEAKISKIFYQTIAEYNEAVGPKIRFILEEVKDIVNANVNSPIPLVREIGAKLLAVFAKPFAICGYQAILSFFYETIQEMFVEETPNALSAVLLAVREMAEVLTLDEMKTKPNEVIPRLVPILKNRNEFVAYNSVQLIRALTKKGEKIADGKEWMRICFELIELLRADKRKIRDGAIQAFGDIAREISPFDILLALLNNLKVQDRQIRVCTTVAISVLAQNVGPHLVLPALMNEYRTPDMNVQNGALKAMQFLFQSIGRQCADYCYAVTPLLVFALIERDNVHRQQACATAGSFAIGCFASGKEDAILHILNHLIPNIFEPTLNFIEAFMNAMDAMRLTLGPGVTLQYILAGLFHPARKVRSQYWRLYNNLVIYGGGELVPYFPIIKSTEQNEYHRDDFDVFV